MGAIAIGLGCGAPPHAQPAEPVIPEDPAFQAHTATLRATLSRNGILLDDDPTIMTCESADAEHKCARCDIATGMDGIDPDLVDLVSLTIAGYPDVLLRAAHIDRVALCRELRYVGEDDGPVGLAELSKHRMMISIGAFYRGNAEAVEQVVHHEFFHLFDFATLGAKMTDPEWSALKPRGVDDRGPSEPPSGFVNAYATTNEIEDRASVYEYMMSRSDLCALAARDPVVAMKVKMVGDRIAAVAGKSFVKKRVSCAGRLDPAKRKPARRKQLKRPNLKLPEHYDDRR